MTPEARRILEAIEEIAAAAAAMADILVAAYVNREA